MRGWIKRAILIGAAISAVLPVAPAHAMTCEFNDEYVDPGVGDAACTVILTVVRPVCSKFECG